MNGDMGPLEAVVTALGIVAGVVSAWFAASRTKKKPEDGDDKGDEKDAGASAKPLRREDIDHIHDPGTKALALALNMSERLERVEIQNVELARENEQLAQENRAFRNVVLGVIHRLERMPPFTVEDVLAYIREHLPTLSIGGR